MLALNLPAYETKITENDGKRQIFDILRKCYVALTPEEWVRQHFVHYLIDHKGYSKALMGNEVSILLNNTKRRCDTVVYDRSMRPRVIVEYKAPSVKYISKDVFDKTRDFVSRAGTIILFCSVIIWFLSSFSLKFEYGVAIENSILAGIGRLFSWFFYPMLGEFNWAASVSALQGLIAKEQVVSSMTVISGVAGGNAGIFASSVFAGFNPASAYAFMVFNLFSAPCFGAIGAMRSELGSAKKTLLAVLFQTLLAWVIASLVFGVGSLIIL